MAEGGEAARYTLDTFQVLDQVHPNDGIDFLGIHLDPSLGDDKAEKHATRDLENAFLGIESDPVCSNPGRRLLQVSDQLVCLPCFDHNVIDVCLNNSSNEVAEASDHESLVGHSSVLKPERYRDITVRAKLGDE